KAVEFMPVHIEPGLDFKTEFAQGFGHRSSVTRGLLKSAILREIVVAVDANDEGQAAAGRRSFARNPGEKQHKGAGSSRSVQRSIQSYWHRPSQNCIGKIKKCPLHFVRIPIIGDLFLRVACNNLAYFVADWHVLL